MNQEKQQQKNSPNLDSDENNKNEEDLLAFSSTYKTSIYRENDFKENKLITQNSFIRKISSDSTSISFSQECNNLSSISKNISNILTNEILNRSAEFNETKKNYQEKQRKMSSPLYCYFYGSDKFLSKNKKSNIDLDNSQNFVKKEILLKNSLKKINHRNNCENNINSNDKINNLNFNLLRQNNKSNDNESNKNSKNLSFNCNKINNGLNNAFIPNQALDINYRQNMNNMFLYNNYQQQLYNFNYINNYNINPNNIFIKRKLSYNTDKCIIDNYFKNVLKINNNNLRQIQGKFNPILFSYNNETEIIHSPNNIQDNSIYKFTPTSKKQEEKKPFNKREGDWFCPQCHNLNFSFRIVCNRCQLAIPKKSNYINYIKNS